MSSCRTARLNSFTLLPHLLLALVLIVPGLGSIACAEEKASTAAGEAAQVDISGEAAAKAPVTPSFRAAIKEFLTIQNTAEVMSEQITYAMAEQTLGGLAQSGVQITEPIQTIVLEESRKEFGTRFGDIEYLTDLFSPHYAEHFSEQEIREITAFYASPVGQKMMTAMPLAGQATYVSLQESSYAMMPGFQLNVTNRLKAAGIEGMP